MLKLSYVSNFYFVGRQKITALKNISLEIGEGEFIALMGPSGSGKSTLLNLIGGLDQPSEGAVTFEGCALQAHSSLSLVTARPEEKNLKKMDDRALSRFRNEHIGFVFQEAALLPHLTLLENVMTPCLFPPFKKQILPCWAEHGCRSGGTSSYRRRDEAAKPSENLALRAQASVARSACDPVRAKAERILKAVGLENRLHHTPSQLSGGQKQRACIARALVNEPALVLADEPTGNLDSKTGREILELFVKLHKSQKRTTFVIATHDEEIAKMAQRTISIIDGEVRP